MKIGLVCPYHIFRGGGVQECVLAMQSELQKRGHEVKIITPLPRDSDEASQTDIIFVGTSTNVKSPFHTTAQVSLSLDGEGVREMLDKEAFDILHFHEPWVPVMSRQLLSQSKSVNIATFHAKLPETMMSKTIEKVITPYTKSVMKYLHSLTAVSDAAAEYVQSLTDEPVTVVPNGIDLGKYTPNKSSNISKRPQILFIGRLEKRKGLKYLLDAFRLYVVKHPDTELLIAGDGPDRGKLENYVESRMIPNVQFLGFISEQEKLRLLKEVDLFCSPAPYGESFGIVLLEAMASGLVTVAANNPGYTAVMKERGMMSLVNPTDTLALSRRLELLLHDAEIRVLWREWALEYVKQYDYPRVVSQYEALYKHTHKQAQLLKV